MQLSNSGFMYSCLVTCLQTFLAMQSPQVSGAAWNQLLSSHPNLFKTCLALSLHCNLVPCAGQGCDNHTKVWNVIVIYLCKISQPTPAFWQWWHVTLSAQTTPSESNRMSLTTHYSHTCMTLAHSFPITFSKLKLAGCWDGTVATFPPHHVKGHSLQ